MAACSDHEAAHRPSWLGDIDYEHLGRKFVGLRQDLAAEITDVLVNVHWW